MSYSYRVDYFYDSTAIIVNCFEKYGIPYTISVDEKSEEVLAPVTIKKGPDLCVRYICPNDDNNVSVRLTVINDVPEDKKFKAWEACNNINRDSTSVYFCLTTNNNIVVKYDFLASTSDDCLGEMACEILSEIRRILNRCYCILAENVCKQDEYKTTRLITEFFDENDIPYHIFRKNDIEEVVSGFSVKAGPNLSMHFLNANDDNDLTALMIIISDVPSDKRSQILEVCNTLNKDCHHVCFFINDSNDVMFSYDFLQSMTDDCVGEAALELLLRTKHALDDNYSTLMRAVFLSESESSTIIEDALRQFLYDISFSKRNANDNSACPEQDGSIDSSNDED